jgi:alpha/beta superfamily hydrolase
MMRQFPGPAGSLEALFEAPKEHPRAVVVFGHPHPQHGGTMHTKVVYRAAKTLLEIGCAVLRFNFRGVGASAGQWDEGRGERDDFQAGLDQGAASYPGVDLWAAGFSFGAWIALNCGVRDPRVTRLLAIAPPTGRYDFAEVAATTKPTHFIHGDRDELVPVTELQEFYERVSPPKTLTLIAGASHLFEDRMPAVGNAIRNTIGVHTRRKEHL